MRRTSTITTGTTRAALALTLAAGIGLAPARADDSMSLTLMKDWSPHGMHAPFYLAQAKGWFKEAGVTVKIVDGKGSASTVGLVGAGQADIGHASLSVMALARNKGLPVTAIGSILRRNEVGVIFSKGKPYKGPKDFKGTTLVYTSGSIEAPFIDTFLAQGGLKRSDVNLLAVAASAKIATYLSGRGDGVIGPVPFFLAIAAKKRPSGFVGFAENGLPMLSWGIVANDDSIAKKPKAMKAFMTALARSWKHILDGGLDEAVQAMIDQRPKARVSMVVGKLIFNAYRPYFFSPTTKGKPMGYMSEKDWDDTVKTLKSLGRIKASMKTTDFYNASFMPR